jgi:hypothetical protein
VIRMRTREVLPLVALMCLSILVAPIFADGTETLGPPSVELATGTGVVGDGAGLVEPVGGTIDFEVPAGASVEQVLIYWNGFHSVMGNGDSQVFVDGGGGAVPVGGTLIGGPSFFFSGAKGDSWSSTYRADITGLGLVTEGPNSRFRKPRPRTGCAAPGLGVSLDPSRGQLLALPSA